MPIFELTPLKPDAGIWQSSSYSGTCRIHCRSETEAREIAASTFANTSSPETNPWLDRQQSLCFALAVESWGDTYEGRIEVLSGNAVMLPDSQNMPEGMHPFMVYKSGTRIVTSGPFVSDAPEPPPSVGRLKVTPLTEAPAERPRASEVETVELLIKNRLAFVIQTQSLLALIAEFLDPITRPNEPRPTLWYASDLEDAELKALIRELCDEMHRLNSLLDRPPPYQNAAIAKGLQTFGKLGFVYCENAVKVLGTGTGYVLLAMLVNLLLQEGLVETSWVTALLSKVQK